MPCQCVRELKDFGRRQIAGTLFLTVPMYPGGGVVRPPAPADGWIEGLAEDFDHTICANRPRDAHSRMKAIHIRGADLSHLHLTQARHLLPHGRLRPRGRPCAASARPRIGRKDPASSELLGPPRQPSALPLAP